MRNPNDAAKRVQSFATVVPDYLAKAIISFVQDDPDVRMEILRQNVERMDRAAEADYVIPNLSPERYQKAKRVLQKKPQ